MTDRQDAAEQAARDLTAALNGVSTKLDEVKEGSETRDAALTKYGRRNRHLILAIVISLLLDIVLTVVLAVIAVQAHDAAITARHAAASNLALCKAGNVARAQQIQLWDFVIHLPPAHPPTAQQQQNIAAFEMHLHALFAPRDCTVLGGKH